MPSVIFNETPQHLTLSNPNLSLTISKKRGEWISLAFEGRELINYQSPARVPVDFKVGGEWQIETRGCRYLGHELQRGELQATLLVRLGVGELPASFAVPPSLQTCAPGVSGLGPQNAAFSQSPRGRSEYVVTCEYTLTNDTPELRRAISLRRNPDTNITGPHTQRFESFLFLLPGVLVGDEAHCTVEMPGPLVVGAPLKPRLPYAQAKTTYFNRRTSPDFDLGVVLLDNPVERLTLSTWHETTSTCYQFHLAGSGENLTLAHNEEFGQYILDQGNLRSHESVIHLSRSGIPEALRVYGARVQQLAPAMSGVPAWVKKAVFMEVDPHFYGGFQGIREKLPWLREHGFTALYLMPIHQGSYGVSDHYSIDPALGSPADLREMVDEAHRLGIRVLLDLLITILKRNSRLAAEHPEYFQRDEVGRICPHFKWHNAAIDPASPGFRAYISEFAAYCVREYGVDGFRVDAASANTPNWYPHSGRQPWESTLGTLGLMEQVNRAIKAENPDAILLDELGGPVYFHVSDICHNFGFVHQLLWPENKAAGWNARTYQTLLADVQDAMPPDALRVFYTRNHDSAWFCSSFEYSPEFYSYEAFHALLKGIPLAFSGQKGWPGPSEEGLSLYRRLYRLREQLPVLIEGECRLRAFQVDHPEVFNVVRILRDEVLLGLVSVTGDPIQAGLRAVDPDLLRRFPTGCRLIDMFGGESETIGRLEDFQIALSPFAVRIYRMEAL